MAGRHQARSLTLALAALVATICAGCGSNGTAAPVPPTLRFASRPDLRPPVVTVLTHTPAAAPGYIFFGPKQAAPQQGPEIVDAAGRLVWFDARQEATDFKVQTYRGRPVLTWWEGPDAAPILGTGLGSYIVMDSSYRILAHVQAGFGRDTGDLHEFLLTPRGTAFLTAYRVVHRDTTALGGTKSMAVADSMIQEVDVATGKVLFTWHSLGHIALSESYAALPTPGTPAGNAPWDYFHVNSIEQEPDGNLLISARNTWGVYLISRKTGKVLWRVGGKRSDFKLGPGTRFAWQHDARIQADGTLTLFDDESAPPEAPRSRAIRLRLDRDAKTATLVAADSLRGVLTASQGNTQLLPDGHLFVGWGAVPRFTEFDAQGHVVFDARFSAGDDSYRAFRFPWKGTPATRPAIAVAGASDGRVIVSASWNGATEVARWRVLGGTIASVLTPLASVRRSGFETTAVLHSAATYFAVEALDRNGRLLHRSAAVLRGGLAIG